MKNLTPAARAASSTCCVPSTLTRQRRRPALVSGTSAAWWCTTSTPAVASATRAASRTSARKYSMPAGSSGAGRMSSTRTRSPRAWSARAVWAPRNPAPPVTRWVAIAARLNGLPLLQAPADRAPHRLEERVGDARHLARQRGEPEAPVRDRHAELVLEQTLHRVDDLVHRVGASVCDPVEAPARRRAPLGEEKRLAGVVDVRHRAPRRAASDQRRLALADHGEEARLPRRLLRAVEPARAQRHGLDLPRRLRLRDQRLHAPLRLPVVPIRTIRARLVEAVVGMRVHPRRAVRGDR